MMIVDSTLKKKSPQEQQAALWVCNNRGALTRVAQKVGVTPQFVSMVLAGKRGGNGGMNVDRGGIDKAGKVRAPGLKGLRVVKELRKVGAPVDGLSGGTE